MNDAIKIGDTAAVKTGFRSSRGSGRYGRTTTLVDKRTGDTLFVVLGEYNRRELFEVYQDAEAKKAAEVAK